MTIHPPGLGATQPLFPPDLDVGALLERFTGLARDEPLPTLDVRMAELRQHWQEHHRELVFADYLMIRCGWYRWTLIAAQRRAANPTGDPNAPDPDAPDEQPAAGAEEAGIVREWFAALAPAMIIYLIDAEDGANGVDSRLEQRTKKRLVTGRTVRPWQRGPDAYRDPTATA